MTVCQCVLTLIQIFSSHGDCAALLSDGQETDRQTRQETGGY